MFIFALESSSYILRRASHGSPFMRNNLFLGGKTAFSGKEKAPLAQGWLNRRKAAKLLPERCHINHKAVFHVAAQHALVGFIDLLDGNHLNVRRKFVLGAEIQHLLRLRNSADQRPCNLSALKDQVKDLNRGWLRRRADKSQRSIALDQSQVGVEVVRCGDSIKNKVKAAKVAVHFIR